MERAEKIGLGVATAGHVLLFGLLSAGLFSSPNPLKLNPTPMEVSMVDEVALKSMAPRISTEPPPPSVAPEKGPTEDAAPAPTPAPQPEPAPEPEPEPAPAPPAPKPKPAPPKETPKPAPKPAPAKKDVPKPTPTPKPAPAQPAAKPKAAPAKEQPAAKAAPAKPKAAASAAPSKTAAKPATNAPAKASGAGKAEKPRGSLLGDNFLKGIDTSSDAPRKPAAAPPAATLGPAQKAALNAEISRQLKPHWRAPSGADADQLVTILRWRLNRDGTLADGPALVDQQGVTASNRPQADIHRENAIKAVRAAAPFRLPPEYYDTWKNIVSFRFDRRL